MRHGEERASLEFWSCSGTLPPTHSTLKSKDLVLEWSFLFLQALESLQTAASPIPHGSSVQDLYIIFQPVVIVSSQASCKCQVHSLCTGSKEASGILKHLLDIQENPILGHCQVVESIFQSVEKETA